MTCDLLIYSDGGALEQLISESKKTESIKAKFNIIFARSASEVLNPQTIAIIDAQTIGDDQALSIARELSETGVYSLLLGSSTWKIEQSIAAANISLVYKIISCPSDDEMNNFWATLNRTLDDGLHRVYSN